MLFELNEFLILAGIIVIYWLATELGFRLGLIARARANDSDRTHVSALQSALLGLLALLLGFSFSMALSRYDMRKSLVLKEANAIGTNYLRTDFLATDQGKEARRLLREYVAARLNYVHTRNDQANIDEISSNSAALQGKLWVIATAAAAQDPKSVPAGLFISSLNDVIDVSEERRVATENHVPGAILGLLVAVSCGALGFIGCSSGLAGRKQRVSTITFIFLCALVLVVILDVDRPRRGLIHVSQAAMSRLQTSMPAEAP